MAILIWALVCFCGCVICIIGLGARDPVWILAGSSVAVFAARVAWVKASKK